MLMFHVEHLLFVVVESQCWYRCNSSNPREI